MGPYALLRVLRTIQRTSSVTPTTNAATSATSSSRIAISDISQSSDVVQVVSHPLIAQASPGVTGGGER